MKAIRVTDISVGQTLTTARNGETVAGTVVSVERRPDLGAIVVTTDAGRYELNPFGAVNLVGAGTLSAMPAVWEHLRSLRLRNVIPWSPVDTFAELSEYIPTDADYWTPILGITAEQWPAIRERADIALRESAEKRRVDRQAGMFQTDGTGEREFPAVAFGDRWNGWATPIVTRETFVEFVNACNDACDGRPYCSLSFYGVAAVFTDGLDGSTDQYTGYYLPIQTGEYAGLYDLGVLGWCFYRSTDFQD